MNKKFFIFLLIIILLIIVIISFFLSKPEPVYTYNSYDKYNLTITVDTKNANSVNSVITKVYNDGQNLKIVSNNNNLETYIIGDKMYYLKDNIFYIYKLTKSYKNLYDIVSKFKPQNDDDIKYFNYQASTKEVNEFLDCIYANKKTKKENTFKIRILDNRIDEVSLLLTDIDPYTEVYINLKYSNLDNNYKVDTSKIYSSSGTSIRYKFENTNENPYEILKN